jgi:putative transposase
MPDEMMRLRTLLEQSADADLLREMVGFGAQRLMELELESLTAAAHGSGDATHIIVDHVQKNSSQSRTIC